MLYEMYTKLDCNFTDRDREKCIPTIYRLVELANMARQSGILMLEAEMEHEESVFLSTALALLIEGSAPEFLRRVLSNLILAGGYSGAELLSRIIIAEGVVSIQEGANPRNIGVRLFSILGEKYLYEADEAFRDYRKRAARLNGFLSSQRLKRPIVESMLFEETIGSLDDRAIQSVVYDFDDITLFEALIGCSHRILSRIMTNIPLNTAMSIIDEWERLRHVHNTAIVAAQDEILKRLKELEAAGEIIISKRL